MVIIILERFPTHPAMHILTRVQTLRVDGIGHGLREIWTAGPDYKRDGIRNEFAYSRNRARRFFRGVLRGDVWVRLSFSNRVAVKNTVNPTTVTFYFMCPRKTPLRAHFEKSHFLFTG